MNPFIRIIIAALISIAVSLLFLYIDKNNQKQIIKNIGKDHITVRLPNAYLWLGCLDVLLFAYFTLMMVLFPNDTAATWVFILFSFFITIGVFIIMAALIWKIDVFKSKDYFLYRTIFFRNYTIYYSDCICYEFKGKGICLKTSFKTFQIDGNATNFEFILAMLVKNKVKEK